MTDWVSTLVLGTLEDVEAEKLSSATAGYHTSEHDIIV